MNFARRLKGFIGSIDELRKEIEKFNLCTCELHGGIVKVFYRTDLIDMRRREQ